MKQLCMWFTILAIFLLIFVFWNPNGAVEDPITAFGAVKFNKGTVAPDFFIENLAGDRVKLGQPGERGVGRRCLPSQRYIMSFKTKNLWF